MSNEYKMYNKYRIEHVDGTPLKGKEYFVLRLDSDNPAEAASVAAAMRAYKNEPRNCDVGTSDEQAERFENFCLKHIGCAEETGGRHCVGCPLEKASRNITQKCELYWAQMPYSEGETDGGK